MSREERLSRTFVELADTLVGDFDVVEFLHRLVERCMEMLDAAAVGVMLADQRGVLRVMASSSERTRLLELFELQNDEGPCLECYRTGRAVVNEAVEPDSERWPLFAAEASAAGFRSVHALPMRMRAQTIGALNLFRHEVGRLSEADIAVGQAMADVATIGILQERALSQAHVLSEQLQGALNSRVVIEQAKGVLAERVGLDMDHAFSLLRDYARNHNCRLSEAAREAVDGTLTMEQLQSRPGAVRQSS